MNKIIFFCMFGCMSLHVLASNMSDAARIYCLQEDFHHAILHGDGQRVLTFLPFADVLQLRVVDGKFINRMMMNLRKSGTLLSRDVIIKLADALRVAEKDGEATFESRKQEAQQWEELQRMAEAHVDRELRK